MNITLICKGGENTGLGHLHRSVSFVEGAKEYAKINVIAIIDKGLEVLFREIPEVEFIYDEGSLSNLLEQEKFSTKNCIIDTVFLSESNQQIIRKKYEKVISISPKK